MAVVNTTPAKTGTSIAYTSLWLVPVYGAKDRTLGWSLITTQYLLAVPLAKQAFRLKSKYACMHAYDGDTTVPRRTGD
jgi:hypothetical protein